MHSLNRPQRSCSRRNRVAQRAINVEVLESRALLAGSWLAPAAMSELANSAGVRESVAASVAGVEGLPTISVADAVVAEGTRGKATRADVLVSLSSRATSKVRIAYETEDGSADAAGDFRGEHGTLVIRRGDSAGTIRLTIRRDTVPEADEVFHLALTDATNATMPNAATGENMSRIVIRDDDTAGLARPVLAVSNPIVAEGDAATFVVTLSDVSTQDVSVRYRTEPGSASSSQFTEASGTMTIPAGQSSATITVPTREDSTVDGDQQFSLRLSVAANADLGTDTATGTIVDDEPPPQLSVASGAIAEGNSDTASLTFTVTLSAESTSPVTVSFATVDDTAAAGTDYVAASGSVTFAPGETSKLVTVTVHGDTTFELDESFQFNLSNPVNATIAAGTAVGTIANDDATPAITVTGFLATEGDGGTTTGSFTVTLSAASSLPISVDFATSDGSATAGSDYEAASGTLTFAPGERSKLVTVTIAGDTADEPNETIVLQLANPTGATFSSDSAVGTIVDDDTSTPVTLTPAVTQGPYFNEYSDAALNRSDITTGTTRPSVTDGVPVEITFNVFQVNGTTVTPLAEARVDLWHADAIGKYSDEASEGTSGQTFLRGYQFTDSSGAVAFDTIFPGWYPGRTPHIHFMVRTTSAAGGLTNRVTSQLFFNETLSDAIYAAAPYNSRGTRNTTNATDGVYNTRTASGAIAGPLLIINLTQTPSGGYTGTFNVFVQAT